MTSIHGVGVAAHDEYARRQEALSQWQKLYHLPAQGLLTPVTPAEVSRVVPQASALYQVTGLNRRASPVRFTLPRSFADPRPPAPLARLGAEEKLAATEEQIGHYAHNKHPGNREVEKESETLVAMCYLGRQVRIDYDYATACMKRFVKA